MATGLGHARGSTHCPSAAFPAAVRRGYPRPATQRPGHGRNDSKQFTGFTILMLSVVLSVGGGSIRHFTSFGVGRWRGRLVDKC
jgi:hypothetical protein